VKVIGNLTKDAIIRAAVSEGLTVTQAVGTDVIFNSGSTTGYAAAFDSSTGKVVIAFCDGTDGTKGKAIVGTVDPSNNSISFGSEVVFQNSEVTGDQMDCVFDSNANKVVIFYTDTVNSRSGAAIVGTVSGTSISFGTKATFESGNTSFITATFDSTNNKAVVFYRDEGNSNYGTAAVGTVSGTGISFGSPVVFNSANTPFLSSSFDSNAGKILVVYKDVGNSNYGNSIVGTVSGTSISFGSEVTFLSANGGFYHSIFDSSANKHVVLYDNPSDNNYGYARVGTISGTSVSYGTAAKFETGQAEYMGGVFDSNAGKIAIVYKDGSNSNRPTFVSGTVSGTDISFDTPVVLKAVEGVIYNPGVAYDSTNKRVVAAYLDSTGSDNGLAQVISVGYTSATGGTIADGKPVIVNANGTVSSIAETSTSFGSAAVFESASTTQISSAYDTTNNKVIVAYRDSGNSNYGTAAVGTVSGTSISFGTPVVFNSGDTRYTSCTFDSSNEKMVISYVDWSNNERPTSVVGTVSGTSISFGSEVVISSVVASYMSTVFDSSGNKIIATFRDDSNSGRGRGHVGTVSGTSISYAVGGEYNSDTTNDPHLVYDSNRERLIVSFIDAGTGADTLSARVGTLSGNSISWGQNVQIADGCNGLATTFDSNVNKLFLLYKQTSTSNYPEARLGTITSGGTDLTFTSATAMSSAADTIDEIAFDSSTNSVLIPYKAASTNLGSFRSATTDGTSITFSGVTVFENAQIDNTIAPIYDPDTNKFLISYRDADNSNYGTSIVGTVGSSNITSENFVGFMDGAALDGTNGEILSSCSIARNQTSLTPGQTYFVTSTGALSTTAGSPSVKAGTAISSTELIVKG